MGESTSEIEREILAERAELDRNLETLERKARDLTDWHTHFRNHTGTFLAAAAGAGVVLGVLTTGRSPSERTLRRTRLTSGGVTPHFAMAPDEANRPPKAPWRDRGPKSRELVATWERASEALLGLAIGKAIDAVSSYLPGFRDQYDRQVAHAGLASDPGATMHREPERRDH